MSWSTSELRIKEFKPSSNVLIDRSKTVFLLWIFLLFEFVFAILSCLFHSRFVVTFFERVEFLALLLCDVFL